VIYDYLIVGAGPAGCVLAKVDDKTVYLPINLDTMERLCGRTFTTEQLKAYFEQRRLKLERIENTRDVEVSQVGEELHELFFRDFTTKQWGLYPEQLAAEVTKRLSIRYNCDTRCFDDPCQGIPKQGFTTMFERIVSHPNITLRRNAAYPEAVASESFGKLIYTGPIDAFFDYALGRLPYRSLAFAFETLNVARFQEAGVVNFPNEGAYTRITEFKHLHRQERSRTIICYECGAAEGPPYYPILTPANRAPYRAYRAWADELDDLCFLGRLAQHEDLNMDQVVGRALELYERMCTRE